jgi:hypothetical protein
MGVEWVLNANAPDAKRYKASEGRQRIHRVLSVAIICWTENLKRQSDVNTMSQEVKETRLLFALTLKFRMKGPAKIRREQ